MSGLRLNDPISNGAGDGPVDLYMQSAAKGYMNLDGTGTISVRHSLNVSSVTDVGTGEVGVSLIAAMSNSDPVLSGMGSNTGNSGGTTIHTVESSFTPSYFILKSFGENVANSVGGIFDASYMAVSNHGDLA